MGRLRVLVFGILFVLPWVALLYGVFVLVRRNWPAAQPELASATIAPAPSAPESP